MLVSVYVDESCLGNGREGDNPGGAGGLIEARGADGLIVRRDFWIAEPSTTNNRMADSNRSGQGRAQARAVI